MDRRESRPARGARPVAGHQGAAPQLRSRPEAVTRQPGFSGAAPPDRRGGDPVPRGSQAEPRPWVTCCWGILRPESALLETWRVLSSPTVTATLRSSLSLRRDPRRARGSRFRPGQPRAERPHLPGGRDGLRTPQESGPAPGAAGRSLPGTAPSPRPAPQLLPRRDRLPNLGSGLHALACTAHPGRPSVSLPIRAGP